MKAIVLSSILATIVIVTSAMVVMTGCGDDKENKEQQEQTQEGNTQTKPEGTKPQTGNSESKPEKTETNQ